MNATQTTQHGTHVPVLLEEAVSALCVRASGRYLDGTFGRGGHAQAVLAQLGQDGVLLLMDKDWQAVETAQAGLAQDERVHLRQASFATLGDWPEAAELDGVLLDLGVSSPQLDQAERGFAMMKDGPLDMRMNPSEGQSVAEWLADVDETVLADVIWRYGEERQSRRIARAIVAARLDEPMTRTGQLAALIERVMPRREKNKHPATRTFQALRIFINQELDDLEQGLEAARLALKPGGRLVVISFHSLEDRIVKQFINKHAKAPAVDRRLPVMPDTSNLTLKSIGKAIKPSKEEIARNPRARSAVMRVAERLAA